MLGVLSNTFLQYNSFFYWRDLIEILFFAMLFYYAALWLKKDKQKNLLPSFYGYCALTFSTHFMGLTSISHVLFLFAPVAAMIFILMHQELLQKNLIALKNLTPTKHVQIDWLETLIKTSLRAINDGKAMTCVIEQCDSLQNFLTTALKFNAKLDQGLLDILLASTSFDQQKMIWLNTQGQLIGINAVWSEQIKTESLERNILQLPEWKQQALFFTSKMDALVITINPINRTFDVITNGMVIDRMHAAKTLAFIKKYILSKRTPIQTGVMNYARPSQKNTNKQRST